MAVSIEPGKRGGREAGSGELNLVPYIDLLTCMIAFLMLAATLTQLARLKASQRGQGEAGDDSGQPKNRLSVLVHAGGFNVLAEGEQRQQQRPVAMRSGRHDFAALAVELKRLKDDYPDQTELRILSEDPITFEILMQTMDTVLGAGFPDVALLDATGSAP